MNKKVASLMIAGAIVVCGAPSVISFADTVNPDSIVRTEADANVVNRPEADADNAITITGAGDTTVKVGDKFDPKQGVTVKDSKGEDLTKSLKVDGVVDTDKAGKYDLKYSVTGADGKTATSMRTITVAEAPNPNSEGIVIEHSLKDGDKISMGSDIDINEGVSAKCPKHPDAKVDVKVESGIDMNKVGEYPVTFKATCPIDNETKTETIHVKVVEGDQGTNRQEIKEVNLDGATYKEINVGDNFNPMEGVTAIDQNGNDITKNIKVDGNVDTSKEGKYTLHYTYKDGKGKELCNMERTIVVRPAGAPLFSGIEDRELKLNDKFDPMEGVKATDKKDGDLTKNVKVDGTVDTSKEGKYVLTYTVTDSEGNTTKVERTITVGNVANKDESKPAAPADMKPATGANSKGSSGLPGTGAEVTSLAVPAVGVVGSAIALLTRRFR